LILIIGCPSVTNGPRSRVKRATAYPSTQTQMKPDKLAKSVAIVFVVTAIAYVAIYSGIERRRTRNGPWQVAFTNDSAGMPSIVINQPQLAITNVQIVFAGAPKSRSVGTNLAFAAPRPVPWDVPYGKCIFMDTTFLPGTLVLELFGHEIQLIPRVLIIDRKESPWRSDQTISLPASAAVNERR
jgi:hypothetical protein